MRFKKERGARVEQRRRRARGIDGDLRSGPQAVDGGIGPVLGEELRAGHDEHCGAGSEGEPQQRQPHGAGRHLRAGNAHAHAAFRKGLLVGGAALAATAGEATAARRARVEAHLGELGQQQQQQRRRRSPVRDVGQILLGNSLLIADGIALELADLGDRVGDRLGIFGLEGAIGHLQRMEEEIEVALRKRLRRIGHVGTRRVEDARRPGGAQVQPVEIDRPLGDLRAQLLLHAPVDHRRAVGDEENGARSGGRVELVHRQRQRQAKSDIGVGEAGPRNGIDGAEHGILVAGDRQHVHRLRGKGGDAEAVVRPVAR